MSPENIKYLLDKYPNLIAENKFFCGDGWFDLIEKSIELIDHQLKVLPPEMQNAFKIVQVKEKFGELRIYVRPSIPYIDGIIDLAESISRTTCEECGGKGKISTPLNGSWMRCLCEKHTQERDNKFKK